MWNIFTLNSGWISPFNTFYCTQLKTDKGSSPGQKDQHEYLCHSRFQISYLHHHRGHTALIRSADNDFQWFAPVCDIQRPAKNISQCNRRACPLAGCSRLPDRLCYRRGCRNIAHSRRARHLESPTSG